jgi:predicted AAA+ superfamily ATPase
MSKFVQSEITDRIKYYVQNQSFKHALEIINKKKVVVISGVKGIGKTTLAHLLIYNLLQQKAAQFFAISDSISEGFSLFDDNENQIFFLMTFLVEILSRFHWVSMKMIN